MSNYINSKVFSQLGKDELLYHIMFFYINVNSAKCNYEIYNKKLLVIICYVEEWKLELECTKVPIKIITNRKSLKYLMTTKKFTRH